MSDYEVGFRKPPRAHRFTSEKQPAKRGRKKKPPLDPVEVLRRVTNTVITITENGRPKRMTLAEVMVRSLRAKAINGDVEAAAELLRLRADAEVAELEPIRIYLSEAQLRG